MKKISIFLTAAWGKILNLFRSVLNKGTEEESPVVRTPDSEKPAMREKADALMIRLQTFLEEQYEFRYNRLTDETEYREKNRTNAAFELVNQRALNSFCLEARLRGIACWDRDVSRYILSFRVEEFHPFRLYMNDLPVWDGVDRVEALARRVSDRQLWVEGFHRWMLAMVAGWIGEDRLHANSVAPVLVSRKQGKLKSTFCKLLVPPVLQRYYTDSFDLSSPGQAEHKLSFFGLINMDEFDKLPARKMPLLKNLMQMAGTNMRKAYQKNFSSQSRVASFIGTSNQKELLSDPSGSRRFLCVEVEEKIDCSPLEYEQIYAQLKAELRNGVRSWFTPDEEREIMASNAAFYKHAVEEDVFFSCFRKAEAGEHSLSLSAADIFQRLKKQNSAAMQGVSSRNFGRALSALGVERIHTHYGNQYRVVSLT